MKTTLVASIGLVLVLVGADAAFAKPKKPLTSYGCVASDLQGAEAQACIHKGDLDMINERGYAHRVVCTASGKYCCKVADGTKQISECTTISGKPAVNGRPASGSVQPGGSQAN